MSFSKSKVRELVSSYTPELESKEIDIFLSICTYQKTKNKTVILKQGRTDKVVLLILKGSARAYQINENGKEITNHLRSEGYLFGEPMVFGNEPQMLNVETIGELHYLKFDISELERLGFTNDRIMLFYLRTLKEIILTLSHRVNTFVSMSPSQRYKDLIRWDPKYIKSTFDKHIATFLGVTPLTIHRIKKSREKHIK